MQVAQHALHLPHRWAHTHTYWAMIAAASIRLSTVWLQVPILALLCMRQLAMRRYLPSKPAYYPAVSSPSTYSTSSTSVQYAWMQAAP